MSGPAILVTDLVKRYRSSDRNAVDGISFSVPRGAFFTLLGPNGAGKTTTINILTTILSPTRGTACVAGHDVRAAQSEVRRRVGIIFQTPSLDQNLTAEENIRLHAVMYGVSPYRPLYRLMPAAYRARVTELAELLGIGGEMFKPVRTFSGGMKRKLEIVRSLMHHPEVLFLDEPTADWTSRAAGPCGSTCMRSVRGAARRSSSRPTTSRRPRTPTRCASSTRGGSSRRGRPPSSRAPRGTP